MAISLAQRLAYQLANILGPATTSDVLLSLLRAMDSPTDTLYRAQEAWHYYEGTIYDWVWNQSGKYPDARKRKLHRQTQPYFNPVTEVVDVAADKVFAPPLRGIDVESAMDTRLNAIWTRSNFEKLTYEYVRQGAAVGTVYLHVLDGPMSSIVARRPDVMTVFRNPQTSDIEAARYSYAVHDPIGLENGDTPGIPSFRMDDYTYDFLMTRTTYSTYKNGQPFAYSTNPRTADGTPMAMWPNILGIVPVVEVHHQEDGDGNGFAAWHALKDTMDAANVICTFMAETIKLHSDPLVVIRGVAKADVQKELLDNKTNVFYLPLPTNPNDPEPSIELVEWRGNTSQVADFTKWLKDRLVDVLPELQLARIQEQTNPSGLSVALQSSRFVGHVMRLRTSYVKGLVEADRIAMFAEDVHNNVVRPDAFPHPLSDENAYAHGIQCGPVLPRDETKDFANGLSLLQANTIDREEFLVRFGGYSLPDAKRIIKAADDEAEKMAEREQSRQSIPNGGDPANPAQTEGAMNAQNRPPANARRT